MELLTLRKERLKRGDPDGAAEIAGHIEERGCRGGKTRRERHRGDD